MSVFIPAHIAQAIDEGSEKIRKAFMSMSDEEKSEVIGRFNYEVAKMLVYGDEDDDDLPAIAGVRGEGPIDG